MGSSKVVEVEVVLEQVNKWGVYQATQYGLALLPVLMTAMSNANYVFAAASDQYRCIVPQCEEQTASVQPPIWWPPELDHRCSLPKVIPNITVTNCTRDVFTSDVEPCHQWVYGARDTIVSDFELACEEWKRTLVGTVHNIGVMISMPVLGYVSDKYRGLNPEYTYLPTDRWGRRVGVSCSAAGFTLGAFKTLAGGYALYLALELAEAAIVGAIYTTSFVLVIELGGKDRRVISTAMVGFGVACGEMVLALIAHFIPYWRQMLLVVYCPAVVFLSYPFLLKESLRWLLINGKSERAKDAAFEIARVNKVTFSEEVRTALKDGTVVCDKHSTSPAEQFSVKLLLSSGMLMKRLVVCSWWWFSSSFVYYGLMVRSAALPGDRSVNFALSAFMGVPGDLAAVLLLDRIGRKKTLLLGFTLCGVCCVANGLVPQDETAIALALFLVGKAAVSLCFGGVYVYTSELVPTSARGTLVGACSMLARLGSIVAPLTPLLNEVWWSLPTLLFGFTALSSAALMLLMPETLNKDLPDTIAQADRLGDETDQEK